ncbi:MAG TPA: hypothetical protein VFC00_30740 [Micromonosporaceae bacterium]|nr:hypothetical protein [Micromonosporaceae bacterium]
MGVIEFRLSDEDIKEYAPEGAPEWVPWDRPALDHVPFDVQHPWEEEIGIGIPRLLGRYFDEVKALGIKGVVWLAWKMAGIETPPFEDFNICTNAVRWRVEGGDADPPPDGSPEPSAETPSSDTSPETQTTTAPTPSSVS